MTVPFFNTAALGRRLAVFCLICGSSLLYAQTVKKKEGNTKKEPLRLDRKEIQSAPVRFENYSRKTASGRMKLLDKQIGKKLAAAVKRGDKAASTNIEVQRVFDPDSPGLGADIIRIKKKSSIRHVNRLQRIIKSYLITSFGFKKEDARTISRFLLYYNAHNRGNTALLQKRYSSQTAAALDPKKIGIDRSYRNWNGKTEILLPLRKNVLRPQKTDFSLKEIRKGTHNVSSKEKKKILQTEKKYNQKEIKELTKSSQELEQMNTNLQKQQKNLQNKTGRLGQKKTLQKQQKQIDAKQKEIAKQKKEALQNAAELAGVSRVSGTSGTSGASGDSGVPRDSRAPRNSRPSGVPATAKEQKNSSNTATDRLLFIRVLRPNKDKGHYKNELWYVNANNGANLFRSSFTSICSRTFITIPGAGVVVTGYKNGIDNKMEHRLVLLDADTLRKLKVSRAYVHWLSPIIHRDSKIYAFEQRENKQRGSGQKGKSWFLSRFDTDLIPEASSKKPIDPYSKVRFHNEKIYLRGKTKKTKTSPIQIFWEKNLSEVKNADG